MAKYRQQQDLLFRPLVFAGLVIVAFSISCFSIANMDQLQEESEGFQVIGYRFLVGGIVSIGLGFISKHYYSLSEHGKFLWNQSPFHRGKKRRSKFSDWYIP
jgi:hypothetical protein